MSQEYVNGIMAEWTKRFADHELLVSKFNPHSHFGTLAPPPLPDITVISFKKPNTNIEAIRYTIMGCYLIVTGDLGEAVYAWSQNLTLPFLANCSDGYFREKCQASETGRRFEDWNEAKAIRDLKFLREEDGDDVTSDSLEEAWQEAMESVGCQDAWREFCQDSSTITRILGDDWWEVAGWVGIVPHPRCLIHLCGLKCADAMLQEALKTTDEPVLGVAKRVGDDTLSSQTIPE